MPGAAAGSLLRMWIVPRLSGRSWHTVAVTPEKACRPCPGRSALKGRKWNWMSGSSTSGRERANAPTAPAPMVRMPLRFSAYSMPVSICCQRLCQTSLRLPLAVQTKMKRTCRWSCRFSPTPASSCRTGTPAAFSTAP